MRTDEVPLPHFKFSLTSYSRKTSYLHLVFASSQPQFSPQFDPYSAGNLEPRFENHGLQNHGFQDNTSCYTDNLRGPARYFSYRATLVAIVSQNSLVLVFFFVGYRTIIARYVAKGGIAQMCLCETKYPRGGVSHHFGGVLTSLKKYRAIWGIAAIVSQYRAIWGH